MVVQNSHRHPCSAHGALLDPPSGHSSHCCVGLNSVYWAKSGNGWPAVGVNPITAMELRDNMFDDPLLFFSISK